LNLIRLIKNQIYIPEGFAHGFYVLSEYAILHYICNNYYNFDLQRGININDPSLNIEYKISNILTSEKDSDFPYLKDVENNF